MPPLEPDVAQKANCRFVLLAGATGYVGGRLIPLLEAEDVALRCLARNPEKLRFHVAANTEVVQGDVLDPASLERAMQGVTTAYYLVHLMKSSADFEKEDRQAAQNFAQAARRAGILRIIYLGRRRRQPLAASPQPP
jgi:uncharacterized protein YbjT (DUF2867 family)